jgi:hypothetical protein
LKIVTRITLFTLLPDAFTKKFHVVEHYFLILVDLVI